MFGPGSSDTSSPSSPALSCFESPVAAVAAANFKFDTKNTKSAGAKVSWADLAEEAGACRESCRACLALVERTQNQSWYGHKAVRLTLYYTLLHSRVHRGRRYSFKFCNSGGGGDAAGSTKPTAVRCGEGPGKLGRFGGRI